MDEKPLILDLGKKGRKQIKRLKKGSGPIAEQVQAAVTAALAGQTDGDVIPVVILYEERKKKRAGLGGMPMPMPMPNPMESIARAFGMGMRGK